MNILLIVPAIPVAQPRQRHRVMNIGGHAVAKNYLPQKSPVNAYKASIQHALHEAYQGPPLEGPLSVTMVFVMPRPGNRIWKKRAMPRELCVKKPDVDNLYKSSADALTGLAFRDDAQIVQATVEKWIAAGDEAAHVRIRITQL